MSRQLRIAGLVLALSGCFLAVWQLWMLPFWEYWSLVFLGSLWAGFLFYISLRKSSTATSRRRLFLSTVSGVLLAFSFPPFPVPFLIMMAFIPLYQLWKEIKNTEEKPIRTFWWYAYNAFVIWNIIATFWICNSALAPGIFAIWLNSLFLTVPMLFSAWISTRVRKNLHWLVWVAPWVAFEYGHLNWELSWPWLTLGYAYADYPSTIQWYSFLGVLGGSAWILLVNYLLSERISYVNNHFKIHNLALPALVFILPVIGSLFMYYSYDFSADAGDEINFAIIQPNYEPHYEKFEVPAMVQARQIVDLMDKAVRDSTDYVLLPETVFNNIELTDFNGESEIRLLKRWLRRHKDIVIIAGMGTYEVVDKSEKNEYTRALHRLNDTLYYQMQNAAVAFDESQREKYFKSKFVPGAEIFPYHKVLFFLKPLVNMLGGSTVGYEPQEKRSIFTLGPSEIAPIICYESIYPMYVADFIPLGAKIIAIMTNDGWWGNTLGYRQHNAYARVLAIEMRRNIVRSANSGISSVINARGDILQETDYDERTYLNASISERTGTTFYVRWGRYIGVLAVIAVVLLLIVGLGRRR